MTLTTLVIGARASVREAAIASTLDTSVTTALILEGLPDGSGSLDVLAELPDIKLIRIAPGCLCCTGNLIMRVTLNRILRRPPERLYISLATATHLDQIRQFLTQKPYDALLTLGDDLYA
jgi:hypothetical protein